ncbi:hypothetical protein GTU67_14025, partial [Pusillimonas sp. 7-48]|nr:hypothetical protein [Pusillimonas minor]
MTADHSKAAAWPEETHRKPRLFRTGNIVATPGALELLRHLEVSALGYLFRHLNGDWGDLDVEGRKKTRNVSKHGLFIIKGGQRHSLDLFLRRNTFNGGNVDVSNRFYPRDSGF